MNRAAKLERMNRMIDQQAFMLSANDIFFASAMLFLLLIGVIWLARPVKAAPIRSGGGSALTLRGRTPSRSAARGRAYRRDVALRAIIAPPRIRARACSSVG